MHNIFAFQIIRDLQTTSDNVMVKQTTIIPKASQSICYTVLSNSHL